MFRKDGKFFALAALAVVSLQLPVRAGLSDPHWDVVISDIEIVNDGTNNAIYARGTFAPTLPCPVQGFVYFSTDPFAKEVTAILIAAKTSGRSVSFAHAYCMNGGASNGYGRGNGYVLK